jgi:hypothetical protein
MFTAAGNSGRCALPSATPAQASTANELRGPVSPMGAASSFHLEPNGRLMFQSELAGGATGPDSSATAGRRSRAPVASHCGGPSPQKINLTSKWAHGPHIRY